MKKLFLLTLIGSLFLASCSSEEPLSNAIDASTTKVPVTINVASNNEFDQLRSTIPGDAGIKNLLYVVYKELDGAYIKHKLIENEDLGTVKDTLAEGSYRIAIIAATNELPYIRKDGILDTESFPGIDKNFGSASFCIKSTTANTDYFYKDFALNVGAKPIEQSTILERITAKVEIVPLDAADMPEDIVYLGLVFDNIGQQGFNFKAQSYFTDYPEYRPGYDTWAFASKSYSKEELMTVTKDNPISMILFPFQSTSTNSVNPNIKNKVHISVKFFTITTTTYPDRVIKSEYTLERNKILRLTGNMFTSNSSSEVTIDDEWDADVVEDNFD